MPAESAHDSLADEHDVVLPTDVPHLPVGRPVTHRIYRDALHPSCMILPFTAQAATREQEGADPGAR